MERQTKFVFLFAAVTLAIYFPVALWTKYSVPELNVPGEKLLLRGNFIQGKSGSRFAGHAYLVPVLKQFDGLADSANSTRSPLVIYEDDHPLGPPHSDHLDIQDIGKGRYSHWKGTGLLFSTSDNSDPNVNGRAYWVVIPSLQEPK